MASALASMRPEGTPGRCASKSVGLDACVDPGTALSSSAARTTRSAPVVGSYDQAVLRERVRDRVPRSPTGQRDGMPRTGRWDARAGPAACMWRAETDCPVGWSEGLGSTDGTTRPNEPRVERVERLTAAASASAINWHYLADQRRWVAYWETVTVNGATSSAARRSHRRNRSALLGTRKAAPPGRGRRLARGGYCRSAPAAICARTSSMSRPLTASHHLRERGGGQRAGLVEDQDPVAEGHQRGDREDLQLLGERLLGLGVDLRVHDVGVLVGRGLEDGPEALARAAPLGPEVDRARSRCPGSSGRWCRRSAWWWAWFLPVSVVRPPQRPGIVDYSPAGRRRHGDVCIRPPSARLEAPRARSG